MGFRIPNTGQSGAVGLAVDTTDDLAGHSWVRINGGGGCDVLNWIDASTDSITNDGNWCIDAMIREVL